MKEIQEKELYMDEQLESKEKASGSLEETMKEKILTQEEEIKK